MQKIRRLAAGSGKRPARRPPESSHQHRAIAALMKFRLIINLTKRHFKWVEHQCGINGAQLWVLWEVDRRPALRVNELAQAMAMHQSTVSNLIERLAQAKLIERSRAPDDQRVVTLELTESGRQMLKRAPKPARGVLPEALHLLGENELASLDQLLGRVLHHMPPSDTASMKKHLVEVLTPKRRARAEPTR